MSDTEVSEEISESLSEEVSEELTESLSESEEEISEEVSEELTESLSESEESEEEDEYANKVTIHQISVKENFWDFSKKKQCKLLKKKLDIDIVKRGDIVENTNESGYRTQGVYFVDEVGENISIISPYDEYDDYGTVPVVFHAISEFPLDYWEWDQDKYEFYWHSEPSPAFYPTDFDLKEKGVVDNSKCFYFKHEDVSYLFVCNVEDDLVKCPFVYLTDPNHENAIYDPDEICKPYLKIAKKCKVEQKNILFSTTYDNEPVEESVESVDEEESLSEESDDSEEEEEIDRNELAKEYDIASSKLIGDKITQKELKKGVSTFDLSLWDDCKVAEQTAIEFETRKKKIIKGLYECKKCGCNEIYTQAIQMRSGDEATDNFALCSKCQNLWRV